MARASSKRYVLHEGNFVFRPAEVISVRAVTPRMIRVTFGGPAMREVKSLSPDDDIRIQFPEDFDATPLPPVVSFNPFELIYPENAPPSQLRAFTIRRLDTEAGELDLDFAIHGDGIASCWAEQVRPGRRVTIGGPHGSRVLDHPADPRIYLGDPTALPAIGRAIESLPAGATATIVIEVDGPEERQAWVTEPDVTLTTHWIYRNGATPGRSTLLEDAVRALPQPPEGAFVFAAGESSTMRRLRRQITSEWGISTDRMSISGYWRRPDDEAGYFVETEDDQA